MTGRPLSAQEQRRRASRLGLVLTDVDGVLTDAGVYYGARGEELRRFSVRDGMGIERLRALGVETGFITRETSRAIAARAEKLQLAHVYLGIRDKAAWLQGEVSRGRLSIPRLAYIGDDLNDLEILQMIGELGLTGAPADAMQEVKRVVHFCSSMNGGHGAFRELAEWLVTCRQGAAGEGEAES